MNVVKVRRNVAIQILRIIACLLVFIVHFGQRTHISGSARLLTEFGKYGVQLFFIISGLLAAMGLNKKEKISVYYKKRIINILPLYYLVIIWYFVTEVIINKYFNHIPVDTSGLEWFRYIFLLNGLVSNDTYFWSNLGITWTIPIFAFFYLIIPFVIKFIKSYKSAFCVMILIFLLSYFGCKIHYCTILDNISYFFIGVFIYYCWKENKLEICSLFFLILSILYAIFDMVNYPFIFAVIFSVMLGKKLVFPICVQKIINKIDGYTYTVYLIHGVVFCSLIDKLSMFSINLSNFFIGMIAIVLTFVCTVIVHDFIEKPLQKFLTRKLLDE